VSKTERALDEPVVDDAPIGPEPFDPDDFGVDFEGRPLTDPALGDEHPVTNGRRSRNGGLPAPTVPTNGLAPPVADGPANDDDAIAAVDRAAGAVDGRADGSDLLDEPSPHLADGFPAPSLGRLDDEVATAEAAPAIDRPFDRADDEPVTEERPPGSIPGSIPGEALRVAPPGADVLEELRRADIDGPTVDLAPQDDTASSVRRPHRLREYDPAPIPIPVRVPRLLGRKPRVRKVTRVVRHVDPWSVFKIAIVANLVLYVIGLVSGVLLWNVANATGTVDNVERFFESFGWSSFEFNGGQIYHSAWIAGLFLIIGLTGIAVLAATMFNLITDLVGGMRFTVLEEEVVETRTSPMRRFVVRRPEPEVPAIDQDESGPIIREAVVDDSGAIIRRSR